MTLGDLGFSSGSTIHFCVLKYKHEMIFKRKKKVR